MIRFEQASFSYGRALPVVDHADVEVGPGLTLLLGPNGCGKSTILKLAAGVERPESGTVRVNGYDLWVEETASRGGIAYVPEQPDLSPYATIREIVALVARLRGEPREAVETALARTGLADLGRRSVRELSMGQRRRAVLAAAWIGSPTTLLLDEPLETLDRALREEVVAWVDGVSMSGGCVLLATHEIEPFEDRAAAAITVRSGRVDRMAPLPEDRGERRALLERLARGLD